MAIALKGCIVYNGAGNIQVAIGSALLPRTPMPLYFNGLAVLHSRRDGYTDIFAVYGEGLFVGSKYIPDR